MSSNLIRLICPNLKCRTILTAPAQARGKTVRCGQCGMRVRIPDEVAPKAKSDTPAAP